MLTHLHYIYRWNAAKEYSKAANNLRGSTKKSEKVLWRHHLHTMCEVQTSGSWVRFINSPLKGEKSNAEFVNYEYEGGIMVVAQAHKTINQKDQILIDYKL